MKKSLIILSIIILFIPISVKAINYSNEKNNYKITFPDSYYVIDEANIEDNRAFIESYGMFTDDLKGLFEDTDLVIEAIRSDNQIAMNLYITKDTNSNSIWNLNSASEKKLDNFKNNINKTIEGNYEIISQEYVIVNDNKFLKSVIEYRNNHYEIYYHTINNGKSYSLKFNSYELDNMDRSLAEIESIYGSLEFLKVEKKSLSSTVILRIILVIVFIVVLGVGIRYILNNKKESKEKEVEVLKTEE